MAAEKGEMAERLISAHPLLVTASHMAVPEVRGMGKHNDLTGT